jgi:hypothetical protein
MEFIGAIEVRPEQIAVEGVMARVARNFESWMSERGLTVSPDAIDKAGYFLARA